MAHGKDPNSPATTSLAYDVMSPLWAKIGSVLGGTETMRAAGNRYLPPHTGETSERYMNRLESAILWNATELTLNSWVGAPFSDPLQLEGPTEQFKDDIDLQGTDVNTFAQQWFREGISKGYSHVLVDHPIPGPGPRTLADDRADGARPYWVHVEPERLIAARALTINGHEVLVHARILELEAQPNGFAEILVKRIREYNVRSTEDQLGTVVTVRLWQFDPDAKKPELEWRPLGDEQPIDLPIIPLVTFYADRQGFMLAKPPLLDLVNLNIRHWQSTSDQISILTVARFPILAASGVQVASPIEDDLADLSGNQSVIGPYTMLTSTDPNGKYYYVEHRGQAIEAGAKDLAELEDKMVSYGAEFLKRKPDRQTATARALDSAEAMSALQAMAMRFNSAAQQVLLLTAMWLKQEDEGTFEVTTDFAPDSINKPDLDALLNARKLRDISRESYLRELQRRGVLHDKFDPDADATELEGEASAFMTGDSTIAIDDEQDDDE